MVVDKHLRGERHDVLLHQRRERDVRLVADVLGRVVVQLDTRLGEVGVGPREGEVDGRLEKVREEQLAERLGHRAAEDRLALVAPVSARGHTGVSGRLGLGLAEEASGALIC